MGNTSKFSILDSKYRSPAVWILTAALTVSVMTLISYLLETDFSDEVLYQLLSVVKYSSFFVCICSVYLVIAGICHAIRRPSVLSVLGVLMFIFFAAYGACMVFIEAVIVLISGGNG